jgi:hypothetical protein
MADDTTASVIPLHQVPLKRKKDKTAAERAKAYRQRKRQRSKAALAAEAEPSSDESFIPLECLPADGAAAELSVAQQPAVTQVAPITTGGVTPKEAVTTLRRQLVPVLLITAALALAGVGITINGWFARSLGASDVAGWLFLAVGAAADVVAFVMPSCAAGLWQAGQRASAVVGWAIWLMTFVFRRDGGHRFRLY